MFSNISRRALPSAARCFHLTFREEDKDKTKPWLLEPMIQHNIRTSSLLEPASWSSASGSTWPQKSQTWMGTEGGTVGNGDAELGVKNFQLTPPPSWSGYCTLQLLLIKPSTWTYLLPHKPYFNVCSSLTPSYGWWTWIRSLTSVTLGFTIYSVTVIVTSTSEQCRNHNRQQILELAYSRCSINVSSSYHHH